MRTPKPPLPRAIDKTTRRKARGFSPSAIANLQRNAQPPAVKISQRMQAKTTRLLVTLDEMVTTTLGGKLKVGDKTYSSFTELLKPPAPPVTPRLFKILLLHKVKTSKSATGGTITRRGLMAYAWLLIGVITSKTRRSFPRKELEALLAVHGQVAREKSLPDPAPQRAQLTVDSVCALVKHIALLRLSPHRRLAVLAINLKKLAPIQSGCRWHEMKFWVLPTNGKENDVVVWFAPRWGKTHHSRGTGWFLRSVPYLGLSANKLLLALAHHEGVLDHESLEEILDPAFLGSGRKPRMLAYTEDGEYRYVFRSSRRGVSMTCVDMNRVLRAASLNAGFRLHVTTYCFRHLVAFVVYQKAGLSAARAILNHSRKSRRTATYIGNEIEADKMAMRKTTIEDADVPTEIDRAELKGILADPALSKHRNIQNKLRLLAGREIGSLAELSEDDYSAYRQALTAYLDRFKLLVDLKLQAKRDKHFDDVGFPELAHVKIKSRKTSVAPSNASSASPAPPSTVGDDVLEEMEALKEQENIAELEKASPPHENGSRSQMFSAAVEQRFYNMRAVQETSRAAGNDIATLLLGDDSGFFDLVSTIQAASSTKIEGGEDDVQDESDEEGEAASDRGDSDWEEDEDEAEDDASEAEQSDAESLRDGEEAMEL
ncbi:hypothetical protein P7C73_g4111, partial [Tremellales sp. Uapishka_1]